MMSDITERTDDTMKSLPLPAPLFCLPSVVAALRGGCYVGDNLAVCTVVRNYIYFTKRAVICSTAYFFGYSAVVAAERGPDDDDDDH